MAVRIKDGMIPYTGGIGIEITDNHVINVLLRAANNLIMVNGDRELYVDLQLDDGIEPDDDLPVGVTTGKILEEDGWPMSGQILNWKTTSGDYVRLIYAVDDNLYYDPGTGEWRLLATWSMVEEALEDSNTKTFWIEDNQDLENAQSAYDWYADDKNSILIYDGSMFSLTDISESGGTTTIEYRDIKIVQEDGASDSATKQRKITLTVVNGEVTTIVIGEEQVSPSVLATGVNYQTPYTPEYPGSPTPKQYVDNGLATKQDILTAGNNITIVNNVISATIPAALVYKGSVTDLSDLSGITNPTVGDTYFVEGEDGMYSWDGTQWSYVGGSGVDTTNLFNMTINNSDDITEGSIHLFCTSIEKNYWNSKQDQLIAGANIQISNNVISATDTTYTAGDAISIVNNAINNTKPFDPENAGVLSQVLKKTSTGYRWANEVEGFDPENAGTTGQVLKKTATGYQWANESGGGGGGGTTYYEGDGIDITNHVITNTKPFEPSTGGSTGQVLTKTANGYDWATIAGGEGNVKLFTLSSLSDTTTAQAVLDWTLAGKMPILKYNNGNNDVYLPLNYTNPSTHLLHFMCYMGPGIGSGYTYEVYDEISINYSGTTVTNISYNINEVNKSWKGSLTDYNNLSTVLPGVVYNITSNS